MSVAIVRSFNHFEGTKSALELIDEELKAVLGMRKKFLIKPNFVSSYIHLAVTPVETVEAMLSYIHGKFNVSEVIVAETPTVGSISGAIKNFGYEKLRGKYKVDFVDLEDYDYEGFILRDENDNDFEVYVSKLLLDKDFVRASICRAKTHDYTVVTLSIKNYVVGAIKKGWRHEIHRGYLTINYAIAKLATYLAPDLGVVDGVIGMEGNGPISGQAKKWGAVFASTNPVNLDVVVSYAMGFNPGDIGYLYFLAKWGYGEIDLNKVRIIGENIDKVKTSFKPHSLYKEQLSWRKNLDKIYKPR